MRGKHLGCQGGLVNATVSTSSCKILIDTIYKAPKYLLDSFEIRKNMIFEKGPNVEYIRDPNKLIISYRVQCRIISSKVKVPQDISERQRNWEYEKRIMCFNSETFENNYPIINQIKFCDYSEKLSSKLKRNSRKY
ncbi:MAG TPA: hypothetical protein ENK91_08630 [Bacteroidetes bacterium]|nr:hypothetical protein [Bacteroidota bacterium]